MARELTRPSGEEPRSCFGAESGLGGGERWFWVVETLRLGHRQVVRGEPGASADEEVYLGARPLDPRACGRQVYPRGLGSIALDELLREQCQVLDHAQEPGPRGVEDLLQEHCAVLFRPHTEVRMTDASSPIAPAVQSGLPGGAGARSGPLRHPTAVPRFLPAALPGASRNVATAAAVRCSPVSSGQPRSQPKLADIARAAELQAPRRLSHVERSQNAAAGPRGAWPKGS